MASLSAADFGYQPSIYRENFGDPLINIARSHDRIRLEQIPREAFHNPKVDRGRW